MLQNTPTLFCNTELDAEIRVVINDENEPLFVLKDLCQSLGLSDSAYKKWRSQLTTKGVTQRIPIQTNGGIQEVTFVKEASVYRVIMRSYAEKAEAFQDWVRGEVLPSIRKTGSYSVAQPVDYKLAFIQAVAANPNPSVLALQMVCAASGMTLPGHTIESGLTISKFAEKAGIALKAKDINLRLAALGLQTRDTKQNRWIPTHEGYKYLDEYLGTDGVPKQTLVIPDAVDALADLVNSYTE